MQNEKRMEEGVSNTAPSAPGDAIPNNPSPWRGDLCTAVASAPLGCSYWDAPTF